MNILSLLLASALGTHLLPGGNRIVCDNALKAAYLADLAADRAWTDCKTPEALRARQSDVRSKLVAALGGFPARTPLNVRVTGRVERDGYAVEKLLFESEPNHHVTAHLFLPDANHQLKGCPGLRPGVLIPCGHSTNGKASKGYQRGAVQAALRGMVALVYDPIDQGERAQCRDDLARFNCTGHNNIGHRAELLGWNTARFRIWDGMRALDVLAERPEVNPDKLAVMGHSGGGTMTAWLMALDDRVTAAAPSGFISTMRSVLENCGPQDAEQFAFGELAFGFNHLGHIVLRAPSPVLHCASYGDFFPLLGVMETAARAREIYAMLGRSDAYRLSDTIGPHHWHESTRTLANDWMAHKLLGCPAPGPTQDYRDLQFGFDYDRVDTALGYEPKNATDMYTNQWEATVTPTGKTLDLPGERTVYDIMKDEAARMCAARGPLSPDAVRSAAGIRPADEIRFNLRNPDHTDDAEFVTLVTDDGTPIPTVTLGRGEPVLLVADAVKRTDLQADVDRLVKAGHRVTVADLRGWGETSKAMHRFYGVSEGDEEIARLYATVGNELVGKRAEDAIAAATFVARGRKVKLVARGRAAIPAAHAFYTARSLFSGLELVNPPPSWAELFEKPALRGRFADIVHGAWQRYDWPDLARQNPILAR